MACRTAISPLVSFRLDLALIDNPIHRSRAHLLVALIASTAILALACGSFATAARADGDPASDVLATQALFLPQDGGIPIGQQSQLTGLLQAAAQSGYPIRVAIIASKADLGSVTELWRQPRHTPGSSDRSSRSSTAARCWS